MAKNPRPVTNPTTSNFVAGPLKFKNETGGTLTRGTLVYVSGVDAATGLRNVTKADADVQGKAAQWIVLKDVANNAQGVLGKRVRLTGQNTNAVSSAEDPVYLSAATAGAWTVTSPTDGDPNGISQVVGHVVVKSASVGVVDLRIPEDRVQIGTNEIQDGAVMAAKLGGDVSSLTTVDDSTIELNANTLRLKDLGITDAKISTSAAIARSKLAEDVLQPFRIPVASVLGADGADLAITETAGDFYRSIGTNQLLILGEKSNGIEGADVEVSVGWFEFQLPQNYVAEGDIKIRAGVDVVGAGALGTCTIDFSAYLQNGLTGAVGSDLVSTAATAISKTEANKDFTVTATGLAAGDILVVKMTTSVDNTDSTDIQAQISRLEVLCDVKG